MHIMAGNRIAPFKRFFKEKVVAKRDKYLVMGKDEGECRRLSVAYADAVQMRPWRLGVDDWKSFMGFDAAFVQELGYRWLD